MKTKKKKKIKQRKCLHCDNIVTGKNRICDSCKAEKAKPKEKKCKYCDNIVTGRIQICPECVAKRELESRTRICPSCGEIFILGENESGRICKKCIKDDIAFVWNRIGQFFLSPTLFYNRLPMDKRVHKFAMKARNDIQSTSGFPNYKKSYEFKNIDTDKDKTYDHINSMTYIMENYINECREDLHKFNLNYFEDYYFKYAVQFRVSQKMNMDLIQFQKDGVTAKQYVSVSGPIKGKSIEETIEIIKPHFINQ